MSDYRGRIAPSPTGLLHQGHARTFWTAFVRARDAHGVLILRNEDLDPQRSKSDFVAAMIEDLHWLGIQWQEGPDLGGAFAPYSQSERREHHLALWRELLARGFLYPCTCSRRELSGIAQAPHDDAPAPRFEGDEGPMYPGTCRPTVPGARHTVPAAQPSGVNWRFRVPDGEVIAFDDMHFGPQRYIAGEDFGDFPVWRRDDVPAYQLAVVADDHAMRITEVVRGADLLLSTARQILIYRALGWPQPRWYHCPLVLDTQGQRLAKRYDALAIRTLREQGWTPEAVLGQAAPAQAALRIPGS
ncbi:MAG: glutamate--tRNA ligase family protein [Acidobacteriota bacterium]